MCRSFEDIFFFKVINRNAKTSIGMNVKYERISQYLNVLSVSKNY